MKRYLFIILVVISTNAINADTISIRDLRVTWLASFESNQWQPVVDAEGLHRIIIQLDSLGQGELLRICHHDPFVLWNGKELLPLTIQPGCNFISNEVLESYIDTFPVLLTIVSKTDLSGLLTTIVADRSNIRQDIEVTNVRKINEFEEFFIVVTLILLMLLSFQKLLFPVQYSRLLRNPFSRNTSRSNIEETYPDFFSIDNLYMSILFGLILASNFIYLDSKLEFFGANDQQSFAGLFFFWLKVGGMICLLVLLKFIVSRLVALLFQWRSIPNVQVQDYIYIFTLLAIGSYLLNFVDFTFLGSQRTFLSKFVLVLFLLMSVFFLFWFYFKIVRYYSHKKILIISYLCTTEFLPGFLAITWLMKLK